MAFLDAHVHLQDERYADQTSHIIEQARQNNVQRFFCNATKESDWPQVLELATAPDIEPFLGIHPWFVHEASSKWYGQLESLVRQTGCGIGETGLDKRCTADFQLQQQVFLAHLELSCILCRPLVIHCVQAWGPLLEILEQNVWTPGSARLMIHSFSGSMEIMERLAKLGVFFSYSCALLDPSRKKMQQVFIRTPEELLLLETDAPDQFYSVQGQRKRAHINEPGYIPMLYERAAQLRDMDLEHLTKVIWHNGSVFSNKAFIG